MNTVQECTLYIVKFSENSHACVWKGKDLDATSGTVCWEESLDLRRSKWNPPAERYIMMSFYDIVSQW